MVLSRGGANFHLAAHVPGQVAWPHSFPTLSSLKTLFLVLLSHLIPHFFFVYISAPRNILRVTGFCYWTPIQDDNLPLSHIHVLYIYISLAQINGVLG
jgi:hypothetical protein